MNNDKVYQLNNVDAEREVISALIADADLYTVFGEKVELDLFTQHDNRKAYQVLQTMVDEGKCVEMTEFSMRYLAVGGDITTFMSSEVISYEVTRQRIELLRELAAKRKLYITCTKGLSIATNPASSIYDFQELLNELNSSGAESESEIVSFGRTVQNLRRKITERNEGVGEQGMMTGLHIFDCRFGLHCGDLVIFAGRTSQGKSTLATTIARNMGIAGIPSAYYSLEMGASQLTARILARDAKLTSSRMLYDKLSDGEIEAFDRSAEKLSGLPIYFDDKAKTSFSRICLSIRSMVMKHGIKIAFIDYLQILANGQNSENREQLLADIARDLKRLAVELNICIVAISQLSRSKERPQPTLSDLRGSGQIEEACDMAVLVYRPYVYGIERYKDGILTYKTAQLTIAKGRNIGLAQEIVNFNDELTYFYDKNDAEEKAKIQVSSWGENVPLPF